MPRDVLHNHRQFADLIRNVADEVGIAAALVEKVSQGELLRDR